MAQQFPYQQLQQQANVFATLAGASPGMQTQPMVTSPALTAAQAFGTVYGGLGRNKIICLTH
jgi:hypothetical protein